MKKEKIQLIIKILIPLLIVAGGFYFNKLISAKSMSENNKTVFVENNNSSNQYDDNKLEIVSKEKFGDIEGFYENFGFINDDEILISAGLSREEYYKKYPDELEFEDKKSQIADRDIRGELYRLNLATLEREKINIKYNDVFSDLSSQSKKINFMREESCDKNGVAEFKIYDFNNNSESEYRQGTGYGSSDIAKFSEDGNCFNV